MKRPMPWCKPCQSDGKTIGAHCAFCQKYYVGRIKKVVPQMAKIVDYDTYLGEDIQRLQGHQTCVDQMICFIIGRGGEMSVRVDWTAVQQAANLTRQKKSAMVTSNPGFD